MKKSKFARIVKLILFSFNPKSYREFHHFDFTLEKRLLPNAFIKLSYINQELLLKLDVCRIADGTLLGVIRDNCLIAHDNDIDIDVKWTSENVGLVVEFAKSQRWRLGRKVVYNNRVQQLTYYDHENEIFDFIFWSVDERFALNFSEPKCIRIMKSEMLTSLRRFEVNGEFFQVPANVEDWAVYRYGRNWCIPENRKGDWTETCGDLAIAWWIA